MEGRGGGVKITNKKTTIQHKPHLLFSPSAKPKLSTTAAASELNTTPATTPRSTTWSAATTSSAAPCTRRGIPSRLGRLVESPKLVFGIVTLGVRWRFVRGFIRGGLICFSLVVGENREKRREKMKEKEGHQLTPPIPIPTHKTQTQTQNTQR